MIRRYLLDTGIAQDFQDDRHGVRARAESERKAGHRIGICVPILGELWSGIEGSASRLLNEQRLRHALSRLIIWPYSPDAAHEYAEMRRTGRVIQQIDMQIGA
ncbi:MAG: type II toxin-antitoxin system VapC family toxin, partial [Gemmataceae bacterium]